MYRIKDSAFNETFCSYAWGAFHVESVTGRELLKEDPLPGGFRIVHSDAKTHFGYIGDTATAVPRLWRLKPELKGKVFKPDCHGYLEIGKSTVNSNLPLFEKVIVVGSKVKTRYGNEVTVLHIDEGTAFVKYGNGTHNVVLVADLCTE